MNNIPRLRRRPQHWLDIDITRSTETLSAPIGSRGTSSAQDIFNKHGDGIGTIFTSLLSRPSSVAAMSGFSSSLPLPVLQTTTAASLCRLASTTASTGSHWLSWRCFLNRAVLHGRQYSGWKKNTDTNQSHKTLSRGRSAIPHLNL